MFPVLPPVPVGRLARSHRARSSSAVDTFFEHDERSRKTPLRLVLVDSLVTWSTCPRRSSSSITPGGNRGLARTQRSVCGDQFFIAVGVTAGMIVFVVIVFSAGQHWYFAYVEAVVPTG